LKAVQKQSEQGVFGFPHLPFQSQVAKSVDRYAGEVRGSYDTVCVIGIGGSALSA
jgi:glucose-6-phosphate isomerase